MRGIEAASQFDARQSMWGRAMPAYAAHTGNSLMRVILFLLSGVALLLGLVFLQLATTALHEIEAFIMFLTAAVLLSGAGIIDAIVALQKELAQDRPPTVPPQI